MRICITGGIACGKSLVGSFLSDLGVPVRDADDVCHELMTPGGELYNRIISEFGPEIIRPEGDINRRALADIVLGCSQKREKLNAIMHPAARRELDSWSDAHERQRTFKGRRIVAAIIPLVFEAGWENEWNRIVCVSAPPSIQMERLVKRGLSERGAEAWINTQMPTAEKMKRADHVIFNAGSTECARIQTVAVFEEIEQQAGR